MEEFLSGDFHMEESKPNEVQAMSWPARFIPLSDERAEPGIQYIRSRGLTLDGDMYYDVDNNSVVFPYYFDNHFCGAQMRFIEPRTLSDGKLWKMDTLPGTRLGLLFYGWNQAKFMGDVKGIIVTEGAFNALAISQALNLAYGGVLRNPWRAIACSGSGATEHQREALQELKDQGLKIIIASDTDEAGIKMLKKFNDHQVATHYAMTGDPDKDWNDLIKEKGHKEFAKWFMGQIQKIET